MTDNAKELLALAEEIVGLCEDAGASREYADALIERLSARQQESVELAWHEITDENAPPRDIELLLGWWQEWPTREWKVAAGLWGSTKGGWIHGQATHWMLQPTPPCHDIFEKVEG